MRLAFVTTYDPEDIRAWSGTPVHMLRAFRKQGLEVITIGPLHKKQSILLHNKIRLCRKLGKRFLAERDAAVLRGFAAQVEESLRHHHVDAVFSPGTLPLSFLRSDRPVAFWTDATFDAMIGYYPGFSNLFWATRRAGHHAEQRSLDLASLAIYSSEWAADSARTDFRADPKKVHVVPFGANLETTLSAAAVSRTVESRSARVCRLLFAGQDWARKGAAKAVEIARLLNQEGWPTELTLIGCRPPTDFKVPPFVRLMGFIDKSTAEGRDTLRHEFTRAHFFVLPTQADCTPIVFAEANAFAVPCLSSRTGGVSSMIEDDVNGRLFDPAAEAAVYCELIASLLADRDRYVSLALTSFDKYQTQLNWSAASERACELLYRLVD